MLIYVVEDDATSRDHLTRMLRTQHHEVIAFANAVETTDYIARHSAPDVALIDFQLESWPNGMNLAKELRLRYPNTAIVMISAYAMPRDVAMAFRQGVDDFIVRPAEIEELLDCVSQAARHHRPAIQRTKLSSLFGTLVMDTDVYKAYWHDVDLQLTPFEFSLLNQLVVRPGVVINFAELYSVLKGEHLTPSEARKRLKTHVTNLRRKFQTAAPNAGLPIRASWGHGVYLCTDDDYFSEG